MRVEARRQRGALGLADRKSSTRARHSRNQLETLSHAQRALPPQPLQTLITLNRVPIVDTAIVVSLTMQPHVHQVDNVDEIRICSHAEQDEMVECVRVILASLRDVRDIDEELLQLLNGRMNFVDERVKVVDLRQDGGLAGLFGCVRQSRRRARQSSTVRDGRIVKTCEVHMKGDRPVDKKANLRWTTQTHRPVVSSASVSVS